MIPKASAPLNLFGYVRLYVADPGGRAVLRHESAAVRLLGLRVRIPPGGNGCLSLVSVVCCRVEVSAAGRSLFQRSPTKCGVS
jgi:hypothetical protein